MRARATQHCTSCSAVQAPHDHMWHTARHKSRPDDTPPIPSLPCLASPPTAKLRCQPANPQPHLRQRGGGVGVAIHGQHEAGGGGSQPVVQPRQLSRVSDLASHGGGTPSVRLAVLLAKACGQGRALRLRRRHHAAIDRWQPNPAWWAMGGEDRAAQLQRPHLRQVVVEQLAVQLGQYRSFRGAVRLCRVGGLKEDMAANMKQYSSARLGQAWAAGTATSRRGCSTAQAPWQQYVAAAILLGCQHWRIHCLYRRCCLPPTHPPAAGACAARP